MAAGKEKSLKLNMVLNAIKGLMGIVFPLISFPYVSKILGVENLGKFNFSMSIISYFQLIAGLGIVTYAIREGAKIRDNKDNFKHFADEMFSINLLSTVVSYVLVAILMLIVPKFHEYTGLLIILSLQIVFKTIGIEWIYSIFEDYAYITIRSICFQLLSLVLLFLFVHTSEDLLIYTGIVVIANVGSNILNYTHARKYCKLGWTSQIDWKRHTKPIMVLFGMSIMVTIYASSGTTVVGFLCGDYAVGIFAISSKVYTIVKTVLSSVFVVSIPRLSALLGKRDTDGFNNVATDIYATLLTVVVPAVFGIVLLREQIVLLISDASYIAATSSLAWLGIALLFCMGAWFWGQCVLVPVNKENVVLKVTVVSAIVNVLINFALVSFVQQDAAAIGIMVAEGMAFVWCAYEGRKHARLQGIGATIWKVLVGCVAMSAYVWLLGRLQMGMIAYTLLAVFGAIVVYFVAEIILKNDAVWSVVGRLLRKKKQ